MIATFINMFTVLLGSFLGKLLHGKIKDSSAQVVYLAVGLVTLVLGFSMAMQTEQIIYLLVSLIVGGLIGHKLDIEGGMEKLGLRIHSRFGGKGSGGDFAKGFLDASILFCAGAMTIVGSIKAGIEGEYQIILIKSVMDGFMAIIFTSMLGWGVALSAVTILIIQGGLTLLSGVLAPYLTDLLINEISGTGGVLIIMIGLNLTELKKVKTGNFLPALALIAFFALVHPSLIELLAPLIP